MNIQKPEGLLSVKLPNEVPSTRTPQLFGHDQQDEEASDCPLLTPTPPPGDPRNPLETIPMFNPREDTPLEMTPTPTLENINPVDGLNFMNIMNSSSKPLNDEPSSRDPMVETSSSSGSDTNEPVCAQLLNQLNTAYQHLAPDAQALENGGKPPLVGIQLMVPKTPKDYRFMKWNWPLIRKTCFWSLMSVLIGCTALVIGVIATMPKRCNPPVEWWQGSLFYEIFPASFQDSSKIGDGIGDLRGISMRLDYLKHLGVQGIRLNSIFRASHYPEHYSNITSLTDLEPHLGTMDDFSSLVRQIHERNMSLLLDLPLYPLVKDFGEALTETPGSNGSEKSSREMRDADGPTLSKEAPSPAPMSFQTIREVLSPRPSFQEPQELTSNSTFGELREDHVVTIAIRFWTKRGVDGFYLKGLKHYVNESNFVEMLKHWKSILGPERVLICDVETLHAASTPPVQNVLLSRIDLVDVPLRVYNGTKNVANQIRKVTEGLLFEKPSHPWVHWSIGGVDTKRVASVLHVANASIAASLLGMMLPGTPSIFYGDEIGMVDCNCEDHQDLKDLHNLTPMFWDKTDGVADKFSTNGVFAWLSEPTAPTETSLIGAVAKMVKLRSETPTIYVKAVYKDNKAAANCDIRYTADELIVVERWYPRRNSYVLVANLGNETQTKDLSNLYYGGHVVVGPANKMGKDVYFKQLVILPGEAFVIKLDK
ncbi:neutral and basic amino acid transport protein rBAT isoform X2 [Orussus abietinus]|uniref:neutral and basic amino acid transport protein rBAT isoform X2 n=1 Tax=Orussus abietinus TaxID=222816 RepID=UPI000C7161AD|nr:neutral and basic amino acid transport protein rBAT isoform X2 [Orussus abietinus]